MSNEQLRLVILNGARHERSEESPMLRRRMLKLWGFFSRKLLQNDVELIANC